MRGEARDPFSYCVRVAAMIIVAPIHVVVIIVTSIIDVVSIINITGIMNTIITVVCEDTLLFCELLPCNPAADTALEPLIWCFSS